MKQQTLVAALALGAHAAHAQSNLASRDNTGGGASAAEARPTILLIHGGFGDGSGWDGGDARLRKDGHKVTIVQKSTKAPAQYVAFAPPAIDESDSSGIPVGH